MKNEPELEIDENRGMPYVDGNYLDIEGLFTVYVVSVVEGKFLLVSDYDSSVGLGELEPTSNIVSRPVAGIKVVKPTADMKKIVSSYGE